METFQDMRFVIAYYIDHGIRAKRQAGDTLLASAAYEDFTLPATALTGKARIDGPNFFAVGLR